MSSCLTCVFNGKNKRLKALLSVKIQQNHHNTKQFILLTRWISITPILIICLLATTVHAQAVHLTANPETEIADSRMLSDSALITIEAETFSDYYETTTTNFSDGSCRPDAPDVDLKELGSGCTVGWIDIGEWYEWEVTVAHAGDYELSLQYSNGIDSDTAVDFFVNGQLQIDHASLPSTESWKTLLSGSVGMLTLKAGTNTIRFEQAGFIDLDYLTLDGDKDHDNNGSPEDWSAIGHHPTAFTSSDCTTIVSAENSLQSAIDNADSGHAICVSPADHGNESITINTNNLTLRAGGDVKLGSVTILANDITLDGFEITSTDLNGSHPGIEINGHDATVRNNHVHDTSDYGLTCENKQFNNCTGLHLHNNTFERNSSIGVEAWGSEILIEYNVISDPVDNPNCCDTDTLRVMAGSDQTVRGNYFYIGPTAGASTGDHPDCIMMFDSAIPSYQGWTINRGVLIENNICKNDSPGEHNGFVLTGRNEHLSQNFVIRNNICDHNGGTCFFISDLDNVALYNNLCTPRSGVCISNDRTNNNFVVKNNIDSPGVLEFIRGKYKPGLTTSNNYVGPVTYTPGDGDNYISPYLYQASASLTNQGDNSFDTGALDINYNPRILGKTIDIGPFEQQATYLETCRNCDFTDGTLTCECLDDGGNLVISSLQPEQCHDEIENCNGQLTCGSCSDPDSDPDTVSSPWDYYGNPFHSEYLANLTLDENTRYAYRFRAKTTGTMIGIQNYFVSNTGRTGYAAGDGGKYTIKLVKDNGFDFPDETEVLAEVIWNPSDIKPIVDGHIIHNGQQVCTPDGANCTEGHVLNFAKKIFDSPAQVTAGEKYHIVFENISLSTGYLSLNNTYTENPNDGPTIAPRSSLAPSISDWGVVADFSGTGEWEEFTNHPNYNSRYEINLLLLMDDESSYGHSHVGGDPFGPDDIVGDHSFSDNGGARQVFTPEKTFYTNQLSVGVQGTGVLRATLTGNGLEVGSWTVEVTDIDGEWRHYLIDLPDIKIQSGTDYVLTFTADSGTLTMDSSRDGCTGLGYTYESGGSWCDGYSEYKKADGSWVGSFSDDLGDLNSVAFRIVRQ
jgi:hypothetical protein